jgi:hypothetical protein
MAARRLDPEGLLAAVTAQRAALGAGAWTGPVTAQALGAACLDCVIAAADAGLIPQREALWGQSTPHCYQGKQALGSRDWLDVHSVVQLHADGLILSARHWAGGFPCARRKARLNASSAS